MINKLSADWNRIEDDVASSDDGSDSDGLKTILRQMVGVRDALKQLGRVNVTRTSLKSAVREALLPIIAEHKDELFPELAELRRRLEAGEIGAADVPAIVEPAPPQIPEELRERLASFEERIRNLSAVEVDLRGGLEALGEKISEESGARETSVQELRESITADRESVDAKLGELRTSLDTELQSDRLSVEEKIGKVQEYLQRVEASVPETAQAAASEVETRLRKEIEQMVEQLGSRLDEVRDVLRRIEETVPQRAAIEALDGRLASVEGALQSISQHVENIDAVTPEMRGIGAQFSQLREQVQAAGRSLGAATDEAKASLGGRLDDLQKLLASGIARWESDQSDLQSRLSNFRDSLRDQLMELGHQVEQDKATLWSKLSKKERGVKLSAEDFDELSTKLEGIIGGLEGIISQRKSP